MSRPARAPAAPPDASPTRAGSSAGTAAPAGPAAPAGLAAPAGPVTSPAGTTSSPAGPGTIDSPAPEPGPVLVPPPALTAEVVVLGAGEAGLAAAEGIAAGLGTPEPSGQAFARAPALRAVLVDDAPAGRGGWSGRLAVAALHEAALHGLSWREAGERLLQARRDVVSRRDQRLRDVQARFGPQALVLAGRARLAGHGRVLVDPRGADASVGSHLVHARRVILATGCVPTMPEVTGLLDTEFRTADQLDTLLLHDDRPPATIAVLGAGSTGCALAQALVRLGATVTLVDQEPGVLTGEDSGAAALVSAALQRDGVRLLLGSPVVKMAPTLDGGAWLGTASGVDVAAERLVLATGWQAASGGLDLPSAGVAVGPDGAVTVDPALVTSAPGVLAAGAVVAGVPHAAAALAMGAVAGANAVSRRPSAIWSAAAVATLTLTDPEVACVGLTGSTGIRSWQASGGAAATGTAFWSEVHRAALSAAGEGFVRVVVGRCRPSGARRLGRRPSQAEIRVLGATVVGPRAGDLVTPSALAIGSGLPASALAGAVSADPTWSSALRLAVTRACAEL